MHYFCKHPEKLTHDPHLETLGIFHAVLFPCAFICINTHIYVEWICNKIGLCYTQSLITCFFFLLNVISAFLHVL